MQSTSYAVLAELADAGAQPSKKPAYPGLEYVIDVRVLGFGHRMYGLGGDADYVQNEAWIGTVHVSCDL